MNYYELCLKNIGKEVFIYDKAGRKYFGKIANVDRKYVYLQCDYKQGFSGYCYGYWGPRYRSNIIPIALVAIGALFLASFFFWW